MPDQALYVNIIAHFCQWTCTPNFIPITISKQEDILEDKKHIIGEHIWHQAPPPPPTSGYIFYLTCFPRHSTAIKFNLCISPCICKFGWDVVCWAVRKLGVEEWLAKMAQLMYENARNRVKVSGTFSDDFLVPGRITSRHSVKSFVIYNSAGGIF